jgi:hypothetical protein
MWVYKQETLSAESFHFTLMMEVELVSESLDFINNLIGLFTQGDFFEKQTG